MAPTPRPPTPLPTPQPNLLRNPDFLQDTSAWEARLEPRAASVALAHDQAGFVTLAVANSAAPQSAAWAQTVAVQPGASYRVSYRVHTEKLSGWADLRLAFYSDGGLLLWETGGIPASGDTPWTAYAWRCRAPAGAVRATVSLGVEGALAGRAAFDDPFLGPDDAPPVRALIVDYEHDAGRLRAFQEVDCGSLLAPSAGWLGRDGWRAQGVGVLADAEAIFPNPWANPDDPASYHFEATDAALAAVAASDTEIFFRLGEGQAGDTAQGRPRLEPARWAEVALHVARHYNEVWADGYRYGIRYWEVWSEPEQAASWLGSAEGSYVLLAATIGAFKAHNPALKVGGPALGAPARLASVEGLLGYLAERGLRLDFLSWRTYYDGSPKAGAVAEGVLEQLLERYGLGDAEVIVSSWGLCPAEHPHLARDAAYQAVHLAATYSYWQDTRLARAYYACAGASAAGAQPGGPGEAFRLLGRFANAPRRLLTQGGDDLGFTLLASKSEDGKLVQMLIADTGSRSEEYRLGLAGFPPGFSYVVTEISRQCAAEVVARGSDQRLTDGVLALPWRSPAVHFIEVRWGDQD